MGPEGPDTDLVRYPTTVGIHPRTAGDGVSYPTSVGFRPPLSPASSASYDPRIKRSVGGILRIPPDLIAGRAWNRARTEVVLSLRGSGWARLRRLKIPSIGLDEGLVQP